MSIYCYQKPDKSVVHWRFDKEQLDKECLLNEIDVSECCLIEASEEPKEAYDGRFYLKDNAPEKPKEVKEQEVRAIRNSYLEKYVDPKQLVLVWNNLTESEQKEYMDYRQYLLDYPETKDWYEQQPMTFEEWRGK